MLIKRYEVKRVSNKLPQNYIMLPAEDGNWVWYEDALLLQAKIEELERELDRKQQGIGDSSITCGGYEII